MDPLDLNADSLLDALTSGAVVTDARGRIVYANPVFCEWAGLEEGSQSALALKDFISLPPKTDCTLCLGLDDPSGERIAAFHGAFLSRQSADGALAAKDSGKQSASDLRVKIKHSPLPDGRMLSLLDPFSEDATLTQAHSDFVSTVSHEFRTPLTSIKGFADTLLLYGAQLPDEEKRRFVTIIKDQADRLIRLVENLLTVSKLGAGRMEISYRPVALQRMVEMVTQSVQAKMQAKSPTQQGEPQAARRFEIDIRPATLEVWADPDRLEQVLINLIDNAAKYSPAGSTVNIKAALLPEDAERIRITVQDQGQGIPQELLPRLFTKFYRVETPLKQEVEGTGLGLYITKSLTNAMGGQISADSEPGKGSTFTVILPAATPERQAAHRRAQYADEAMPVGAGEGGEA